VPLSHLLSSSLPLPLQPMQRRLIICSEADVSLVRVLHCQYAAGAICKRASADGHSCYMIGAAVIACATSSPISGVYCFLYKQSMQPLNAAISSVFLFSYDHTGGPQNVQVLHPCLTACTPPNTLVVMQARLM